MRKAPTPTLDDLTMLGRFVSTVGLDMLTPDHDEVSASCERLLALGWVTAFYPRSRYARVMYQPSRAGARVLHQARKGGAA